MNSDASNIPNCGLSLYIYMSALRYLEPRELIPILYWNLDYPNVLGLATTPYYSSIRDFLNS